jgi:phosphoserine aminotransferase
MIYNFNAGPAILPPPVVARIREDLPDYDGSGMSILEMSHRGKAYETINNEAEARIKRLLGLGNDYRVLFMQGGASTQFALVPLNFLGAGQVADYLLTGVWAEKAHEEAVQIGQARVAGSTRANGYRRMPHADEIELSDHSAYVHITSNETIQGTQWHNWPDVGERPLIADMSSDILSRPLDVHRFALIYAGAQKNLGPAGATVVIARNGFLEHGSPALPTMLRYQTHAKNNSLYNTPPVFAVYALNLVLGWIEAEGGLKAMALRNTQKAGLVYTVLDEQDEFYRGHAEPAARSLMNITFRLPTEALEKQFVAEAAAHGLVGLAGHRVLGGIRASLYNAMSVEGAQALADFMREFVRKHG